MNNEIYVIENNDCCLLKSYALFLSKEEAEEYLGDKGGDYFLHIATVEELKELGNESINLQLTELFPLAII